MKRLIALAAAAASLSACTFSVQSVPLPGGTDVGKDPVSFKVQVADALDLVPQSAVKYHDVNVGSVTDISLGRGDVCTPAGPNVTCAVIGVKVRSDAHVPANATAKVQQTSLLGEKFVELDAPATPSSAPMKTGDVIGLNRTGENPEVEQVLGSLSFVLNSGGIQQIQTITTELNKALHGHEGEARDVLVQLNSFVGQLDSHKQAIVGALDALDRISVAANKQTSTIAATLTELPAALDSINAQRHDLVKLLQALSSLGHVGTRVVGESKDNTIATLQNLQPILLNLSKTGDHFAKSVSTLLTYPFVDAAVGGNPQTARTLAMGDYVNLDANLDIDLTKVPTLPGTGGSSGGSGLPSLPGLPTSLPSLPISLPSVTLPPILSGGGGSGGSGGLGGVVGGLLRAPESTQTQRYSVAQLTSVFDPSLVAWYLATLGGAQ